MQLPNVMRFLVYPVLSLLLLTSCEDRRSLPVPDLVAPTRSSLDRHLPETQLFMLPPGSFFMDSTRHELVKDSSTFIAFGYYPGGNLIRYISFYHRYLDSVARKSSGSYYYTKEFKMGSCMALLYYYKSETPGEDNIVVYFGDQHFIATAYGAFRTSDTWSRDRILEAILSMYRDEDAPESVASAQSYVVDLRQSEFGYTRRINDCFAYTPGGEPYEAGEAQNLLTISSLVPKLGLTFQQRLGELLDMWNKSGSSTVIVSYRIKDIWIGGIKAAEVDGILYQSSEKPGEHGQKGILYGIITGKPDQPIELVAQLYRDVDRRLADVKRVASTLRVKGIN
jgi:hypothetical protein